ncbi:AbrB family transcriptional regulator [Undibacterium sp. Jales W-56]|uniref:AbrB family transcriptional regulator n=1 Tax=Undibacterium sp. Jales W-56 TaxID=2897325 RepID=UPI0021CF0140|nr:AbrB family transcriptional regulator [Undibacterium sp. Jales W-56]MCU6434288.1 AbrB family transcriptional regulator [Undibacterium sp. Jales W-56]
MLLAFSKTLLLGLTAALICVWLTTPLPWMIGPLLATAMARMAGADLRSPQQAREAGQWVIGTALGLYFTPAVMHIVASFAPSILLAVLAAIMTGALSGWLLHRLSGVDPCTCFFAMAVGGASEMANQGERHGALVDKVAAAHSLRIMLVVLVIPFGLRLWDVHGQDPYVQGAKTVMLGGLLILTAATVCAALLMRRLDVPNAWVIGPLLVATGFTYAEINLSTLPQAVINTGQLLIGVSLGNRFSPGFLKTAPRYLASVAACSVLAIVLAATSGMALAAWSGMHTATAILATAPGGIAEMSLTAKTLQLGVPIVTAFHVTRMVVLVLGIGPLFVLAQRWASFRSGRRR